jgi:O-methyltransferase involved in polyketide biosynthesis
MMDPSDRPIMATAEDAIVAKHATVHAGYYQDSFLTPFAQTTQTQSHHPRQHQRQRRQVQPIIKRGTHARVCVMDRAISAFLAQSSSSLTTSGCQMVVLGAGKDTSYFRYCANQIMGMEEEGESSNNNNKLSVDWYEVDHSAVIREKVKIIQGSPLLLEHCPTLQATKNGFVSSSSNNRNSSYHLMEHDLREDPEQLVHKLQLNPQLPTLFLLECVFMYLPQDASQRLLRPLSQCVQKAWMVAYEPILGGIDSPFGQMMEKNLTHVGVATRDSSLLQTRTLTAQLDKFLLPVQPNNNDTDNGNGNGKVFGFGKRVVACDMWSAYETVLTNDQRRRANQSEFLDEVEEWRMIMRHYCFLVACGGTGTERSSGNDDNDDDDPLTKVGAGSPLGFVVGKCQVATTSTTTKT